MSARPASAGTDSIFESSAFERQFGAPLKAQALGWRRRLLVLAALLGCLGLFSLARWLAAVPQIDASFAAGPGGQVVLLASGDPALDAHRGAALRAISGPDAPATPVDELLLHRAPRWQLDDGDRERQIAQHEAVSALLTGGRGLSLHLADGAVLPAPLAPRGYLGLGPLFWPLAALALLLYLFAVVTVLARPRPRNLLFIVVAWCQAGNLLFIAIEYTRGLALPAGIFALDMPLRAAFDLATGAAIVHGFALHPHALRHARAIAVAAWGGAALWLAAAQAGWLAPLWWWAQGACLAYNAAALAIVAHSYRLEPNPYAMVMRRIGAASLATLALATAAAAFTARLPGGTGIAAWASAAWYLFFASLLLLVPFLARSRQVLREFALLAGISTVATSLDLLFVAVFSVGPFTSLAIAVFIALGLYAAARQWLLNHLLGRRTLTTERTFEHLYRAARELQQRPQRYPQQLAALLRELFEPLEVLPLDRVPDRSRVIGGGSALVVPMKTRGDDLPPQPAAALVLRFAHRGQRLFTLDDARLADRVVDQLRRAVAYDAAVERGRLEERLRIAQDLHDDIGARLLTLMYQAQSREMEDYIRHTLQDLKTLTRGLAAAEHPLSHAAAEWKADLTQRLQAAHATLAWQLQSDRELRLTVVQWSALTRVLRELVSNALFHGHASHIEVDLQIDGPRLRLQVADDGDGRAPQAWAHGLGLGGVRKRVKVLGGEVAWRENGTRGIVCEVLVPQFAKAS